MGELVGQVTPADTSITRRAVVGAGLGALALAVAPRAVDAQPAGESFNNRVLACPFDVDLGRFDSYYDQDIYQNPGVVGFDVVENRPTVLVADPGVTVNMSDAYSRSEFVSFNKGADPSVAVIVYLQGNVLVDQDQGHIWSRICEPSLQAGDDEVVSRTQDVFNNKERVEQIQVVGVLPDSEGYTVYTVNKGEDPNTALNGGTTNPWPARE